MCEQRMMELANYLNFSWGYLCSLSAKAHGKDMKALLLRPSHLCLFSHGSSCRLV